MSAFDDEPTLLIAPANGPGAAATSREQPAKYETQNPATPSASASASPFGHKPITGYTSPPPITVNTTTSAQDALAQWLDQLTQHLQQPLPALSTSRTHNQARANGEAPNNNVLAAAQPLLAGLPVLKATTQCPNVHDVHRLIVESLKRFSEHCRQLEVPNAHRISVRYMLCSALDEAVLSTPWGIGSRWSNRSLLSLFHQETTGGEKVFQILDQLLQQPREHLPVIEIYYMCLAMGFEGRFRLISNGAEKRAQLKTNIYTQCAPFRTQLALGPSLKSTQHQDTTHIYHPKPLWLGMLLTLLLLCLSFLGFNLWLDYLETPLAEQLRTEIQDINANASLQTGANITPLFQHGTHR